MIRTQLSVQLFSAKTHTINPISFSISYFSLSFKGENAFNSKTYHQEFASPSGMFHVAFQKDLEPRIVWQWHPQLDWKKKIQI